MTPTQAFGAFAILMLTLLTAFAFTSVKVDANELQVMGMFGAVAGGLLKTLVKK